MVEFLHVKPGKGAAFVRSKLKNLLNGSTQEKTFRAGESVEEASVMKVEMQFSYDDGTAYQFMNMETFETESVDKSVLGNSGNFLMEAMTCQVRTLLPGQDATRTVSCGIVLCPGPEAVTLGHQALLGHLPA